jgi:hypothetical protein
VHILLGATHGPAGVTPVIGALNEELYLYEVPRMTSAVKPGILMILSLLIQRNKR